MNKHIKNTLIFLGVSIAITLSFDFFIGGMSSDIETFALNILYGITIGSAISLSGFLTRFILKISNSTDYPIRTYVVLLLSVTLYISVVVFVINTAWIHFLFGQDLLSVFTDTGIFLMSLVTIFVGLIIYFIVLSKNYISRIIIAEKQIQVAKEETAKFQYETLKNQINPHFLFNSLNVLSSLIYQNVDKADAFIINMSNIYRYILDHQDDDIVKLEDEIKFVEKYTYLQAIRYDQNFNILIKNTDAFKEKWIVPMALQLILENVLKHNIISEKEPMTVEITTDKDYLLIINPLRPKQKREISHNLGLKNIEKRYEILTDKKCSFIKTDIEFIVRLPLLEITK